MSPGPRGAWPGALLAASAPLTAGEKDTGAQHVELGSSAAPGCTWWHLVVAFLLRFSMWRFDWWTPKSSKTERAHHRVTPRLLLLGVVPPSDGTLQLYTGPRRVVFSNTTQTVKDVLQPEQSHAHGPHGPHGHSLG